MVIDSLHVQGKRKTTYNSLVISNKDKLKIHKQYKHILLPTIVLGFHYLQLNPHLPNVGSSCHNKLLQPFLGHTSNLSEVGNDFRNSAYVDLLFKDMDEKKEELRKLTVKLFA